MTKIATKEVLFALALLIVGSSAFGLQSRKASYSYTSDVVNSNGVPPAPPAAASDNGPPAPEQGNTDVISQRVSLEADILEIRKLYLQQLNRHADLLARQTFLLKKNGESTLVRDSDILPINVGGKKMRILRETLTIMKGSHLQTLFNGRWEDKLLRDDEGYIYLDVDPFYFQKILDYLYLVKLNKERKDVQPSQPELPKFQDSTDQAVFDIYVDFFRLGSSGHSDRFNEAIISNTWQYDNTSDDLTKTFKTGQEELSKIQNMLDVMEKNIQREEKFISFFTYIHAAEEMTSDSATQKLSMRPIIKLWLDGDVIPVKPSTMCSAEGSLLADKFRSESWLEKHAFICDDGRDAVLMEYPAESFKKVINQSRLLSISRSLGIDSVPWMKGEDAGEDAVLQNMFAVLLEGEEDESPSSTESLSSPSESLILAEDPAGEEEIKKWLQGVSRDGSESTLKLLYRGSEDGFSTTQFHSKCNDKGPTLTVVKTKEGYVFGGYNDNSWLSNACYQSSNDSFIFSLNCGYARTGSPMKMDIRFGQYAHATRNDSKSGPVFGRGPDLMIGSENNMRFGHTILGNTYVNPSGHYNHYFIVGSSTFTAVEIEVFQV